MDQGGRKCFSNVFPDKILAPSLYGMGALLSQEKRPVAYLSRTLGPRGMGLSTYEQELQEILLAIEKMETLPRPRLSLDRTEHESLKYLLEQRFTHTQQHKALTRLLGLDYTIQYKRGVENRVADALSRREKAMLEKDESKSQLMALSEAVPTWLNEIGGTQLCG